MEKRVTLKLDELVPLVPRRFSSLDGMSSSSSGLAGSSGSHSTSLKSQPQQHRRRQSNKIFDDPIITQGYESVPLITIDVLDRGGISLETKSVGRVQFGIPPETIKDSMHLGMEVPSVYIVPVERFCREMGPALGINLAEFEFPAYFNYFIKGKRCTLIVDSPDAERDIRSVFGETLLGPERFRKHDNPCGNVDEDFDPSFPRDARPNFYKEFYNFRTAEKSTNYKELTIDTLLDFVHFKPCRSEQNQSDKLGIPPTPPEFDVDESLNSSGTMRASENNVAGGLGASRRSLSFAGTEDDVHNQSTTDDTVGRKQEFGIAETQKPVLRRRNSDSSASTRSNSTPSTRRNSLGSADSSRRTTVMVPELRKSSISVGSNTPDRRRGSLRLTPCSPTFPSKHRESVVAFDSSVKDTDGPRRDSLLSVSSDVTNMTGAKSRLSRFSRFSNASGVVTLSADDFVSDEAPDLQESTWMYSQAKWLGELATVYPTSATEDQKRNNTTARVEIFKMAGGTEYIIHDVDENNVIVGKARFSGTVRVPDELSLEGFISKEFSNEDSADDTELESHDADDLASARAVAPTFHPPSFGLTILGNSHGFDKNGSTSGYVLWVNGRGIMIDPPPYSSATLEREGIRPQMIMAIIITHCHADHDAGAFQKVMTGARVAIITTPTIYDSFIRKYSALSSLRPTLLRHSHRHRPAIIGQPLRFQGAVFHFTYTLHTIPCISFKVEWRGRSIVFTGDHMNIPSTIDALEGKGVLTRARADELRRLPIQECDVLLHEAGAPPIHTPLSVLQALPDHVKERLYVVHTAAIPKDSGLKVAPTGTARTIRLDNMYNDRIRGTLSSRPAQLESAHENTNQPPKRTRTVSSETRRDGQGSSIGGSAFTMNRDTIQDGTGHSLTALGEYNAAISNNLINQFDGKNGRAKVAPLVFLRPTDVSDAWFILNLLSAVPFLSSLSYAHTMEFLEIAHVEMYCAGEVVIDGPRRPEVLCVFWEGTCVEREEEDDEYRSEFRIGSPTVWHAGDWTGPVSLQPDVSRSAQPVPGEKTRDIIAISEEGVKVITLSMKDVQRILKTGSKLFRKYLALQEDHQNRHERNNSHASHQTSLSRHPHPESILEPYLRLDPPVDSLLDVIESNSVLSNLTAMQKRYFESLAEGPRYFATHSLLWKVGDPVDYAYILVGGTATLGRKASQRMTNFRLNRRGSTGAIGGGLGSIDEHGRENRNRFQPVLDVEADKVLQSVQPNSEYARLEITLQLRAEEAEASADGEDTMDDFGKSTVFQNDGAGQKNRDRFANKVLARLYSRKAYTENLVFSRGNFLSDTSRMVSGDLANINKSPGSSNWRSSIGGSASDHDCHTSNLMAGPQGCIVMVFPRSTLVPFLDSNPGVLLCLLGTQVVV